MRHQPFLRLELSSLPNLEAIPASYPSDMSTRLDTSYPKAAGSVYLRHRSDRPGKITTWDGRLRGAGLFSDAVPLAPRLATTSRRTKPYLPFQHRYSSDYESFADIFAREGRSAPPIDPDSNDAASPVVGQSNFESLQASAPSSKGSVRRPPLQRHPGTSFKRKRTHEESPDQESTQSLPTLERGRTRVLPKVLPIYIRRPSRATATPSPNKQVTVPFSPSSTSSISTDLVICMSSTSTSPPQGTRSRIGASPRLSTPSPSPLLAAKRIRIEGPSSLDTGDAWSTLYADQDDEDDDDEVNLRSIIRRRLSSSSAGSLSRSMEILREKLEERQGARRDAGLERMKSPPPSWGYNGITAPFSGWGRPNETRRRPVLPAWDLKSF